MRPGCDRDAASRLSYDAVGCQVWLDELTDRAGRHQEICLLHAERLTVPRGWFLCDRRSAQPAMFVAPEPTVDAADPPAGPADPAKRGKPARSSRRRRRTAVAADPTTQTLELFEVLRQELAGPALEPAAQPATPARRRLRRGGRGIAIIAGDGPGAGATTRRPQRARPTAPRAAAGHLATAGACVRCHRPSAVRADPAAIDPAATGPAGTEQGSTESSEGATDEPERHHDD